MYGRFLVRPVLGATAVLGVIGTAVLSADTDSLTRAEFETILTAYDTWNDVRSDVDALDGETFAKVKAAFEGDMVPPLTFATAKTVGAVTE